MRHRALLGDVLQQDEGVKPERGRDGNQGMGREANASPRMSDQRRRVVKLKKKKKVTDRLSKTFVELLRNKHMDDICDGAFRKS